MRYLRDDKRICWLEIYLKCFASSEPPILCIDCGQYYTLSTAGLCFFHPQKSEYIRLEGIRRYLCCNEKFYFSTLICDGVQPNLLDNDTIVGCRNKFHRPAPKDNKPDYKLLVPQKYMAIKDDIPSFYLNTDLHKGTENPKTLPTGFDYEVPLSLNAETCISEFKNPEKAIVADKNKDNAANVVRSVTVTNMLEQFNDMSDLLYNAYSDAQKSRKIVKKIRRMKSCSPPRPGGGATKSPGRHRSPGRGIVVTRVNTNNQGSSMLGNVAALVGKDGNGIN